MVIAEDGFTGKSPGHHAHRQGNRLAAELEAAERENEVLTKAQAREWEKLPLEQIKEDRRNVRGFSMLVHGADFAGEKELEARWQRIHIGCGENRYTSGCEELCNIPKESYWTLHMLDNFDSSDQAELSGAQSGCEVGPIKIDCDMREFSRKTTFADIRGKNIAAHVC